MAKAIVLAGLGYGDEGKGTMTEYLAAKEKVSLVVRYNGGCQTAHNVVTKDGKHHTFAQFGSATLQGIPTHLSKFMMVEPFSLMKEASHLVELGIRDPLKLLTIDARALVTTPYHEAVNRIKEITRGNGRHGSCGRGIGETMAYAEKFNYADTVPTAKDFQNPKDMEEKLRLLQKHLSDRVRGLPTQEIDRELTVLDTSPRDLARVYWDFHYNVRHTDFLAHSKRTLLFEGAQGVLLDQTYGFFPHVTRTNTTFENACTILREIDFTGERKFVGVIRAYSTRHGAGPMPSEMHEDIPDIHNKLHPYQGNFRIGYFDLPALKYAIEVIGGVDELMVTHLDTVKHHPSLAAMCVAYNGAYLNPQFFRFDEYKAARGIKVNRSPSLEHQARLTEALFQCTPLPAVGISGIGLLNRLKEEGLNVTCISQGPTMEDKKEFWG